MIIMIVGQKGWESLSEVNRGWGFFYQTALTKPTFLLSFPHDWS